MATGGCDTPRTPTPDNEQQPMEQPGHSGACAHSAKAPEQPTELNQLIQAAWPLGIQSYIEQRKKHWPGRGKHILAHHDHNGIVVYQAFCPEIAEEAVKNQRFGGGGYSFERMSWIKTNFLWMMYRCGWATKHRQERVLAIRITLDGFNQILTAAFMTKLDKSRGMRVRLQWDPDHDTAGGKERRRAIQLGLKGESLQRFCTEWIVSITDVTDFVRHQHRVLKQQGQWSLNMPVERVYTPPSAAVRQKIQLDYFEETEAQLVS